MTDSLPGSPQDSRPSVPSTPSTAPPTEGMVQLTQEGLRRLLDDVAKGQGFLPPGAYRDESGQVWRDVLEPTGRSRKNKETGQLEAVNRKVRRPVYLTNDTSREGLIAARQIAARRGMDFYWPGPPQGTAVGCLESGIVGAVGWLKYGTKREADAPVNLGAGAELFEMAYTPIEEPDDIGTSTATMQGVPIRADAPAPEAAEERSDSGLSGFTDEALDDIPVSSRPRKGH